MNGLSWPDVSESRRRIMASVRSKHTKPEMLLRTKLHAMGYRYRLHCAYLPGRPDLVFPARRKVIEVRGCFWHSHDGCKRATIPATRRDFWTAKLQRNKVRDRKNELALMAMGWCLLVVWECELKDPVPAIERVCHFLGPARLHHL